MQRTLYPIGFVFLFCSLFIPSLIAQEGISYEHAFPELTFAFPVEIQAAGDGSDRLFVLEQPGRIKVFVNDRATSSAATFLDITDIVSFSSGQEIGLLGLVFHPRYADNGYFYVYHTRRSTVPNVNVELVLARYTVSASDPNRADPASRLDIFSFDKNQPQSNHNGGKIAFGPDGYLYASLGDGGGGGDPEENAQDLSTVFGSIFRIDVDVDGSNPLETNPDAPNGNYEIPADNPRLGQSGLDELYAWGLRNTWKFSFDPATGNLWGGDVGQNAFEEINLIERGGNYGWNRFEANDTYRSSITLATNPDTKPIYAYSHQNGDRSITLGHVYRGRLTNPALQGKLLFGDYVSGRVWALDYDAATGDASAQLLFRTDGDNVSSFGLDEAGELYFSGYGSSARLYRFVDNDDPGTDATPIDGVGTWQALSGGITGVVEATATDGTTRYAAGDFSAAGGTDASNIAAYTEAGGWRALAGGANGRISALAVSDDGLLYVGGDFSEIGGIAAANVAVWDGEEWAPVGVGTDGPVLALGINNGVLYAGGSFATAGRLAANNVARWDQDGWSTLIDIDSEIAGTNNEVRALAFDGADIYVGGNFASAGGRPANRIAIYNSREWSTLGAGTSGFVQAIAITPQDIFLGGNFALAGGQTVNRLARWDRSDVSYAPVESGVSGNVNALAYDGTYLYVGGNFETATTTEGEAYLVNNIARWSPADRWEALGTGTDVGTDGQLNTLQLTSDGSSLFAGGNFAEAGNATASSIARWTATPAEDEDAIVDGAVYEMQPQHSLRLRLDVRNVSTRNSALVDGFPSNGGANQRWKFISLGNDVWEIEPQHAPGKRLDVAGASTATNTEIHIYDRHGRNNQQWRALPVGDGSYRFEPLNAPGKRLDIESINGTQRALSRTLDRGNSQRWRLLPVSRAAAISAARSEWIEPDATFTVYPNPASTQLTVESAAEYHFALFDATGREVLTGNYAAGIQRLDVSQLPTGLYIAKLTATDKETMSTRVIIE